MSEAPSWLTAALSWDWAGFGKIVGSAGLGSAGAQALAAYLKQKSDRKRIAVDFARRLASNLEDFARMCAVVSGGNDATPSDHNSQYPDYNATLPPIDLLSSDREGWRSLREDLATQCHDFPAKVNDCQGTIHSAFEFDSDPDWVMYEKFAECGLEAWRLARSLRKAHRIASADAGWQISYLERENTKVQEHYAKRAADHARDVALGVFPPTPIA